MSLLYERDTWLTLLAILIHLLLGFFRREASTSDERSRQASCIVTDDPRRRKEDAQAWSGSRAIAR